MNNVISLDRYRQRRKALEFAIEFADCSEFFGCNNWLEWTEYCSKRFLNK